MKNRNLNFLFLIAMTFFLGLSSCTKEDVNPSDETQNAQMRVRMTDSPGDFSSLDVEIVRVEAFLEGEGWVELNSQAQMVSVLELTNGAEQQVAFNNELKAGTYTMLKFVFGSDNKLSVDNELTIDLNGQPIISTVNYDLEFSGNREVVVEINEELNANSSASLLVDFNVAQSIKSWGEDYLIDPTLELIQDAETGVRGEVSGAAQAMVKLTDGESEISTMVDAEGRFLLRGMAPGEYMCTIFPESDPETGDPVDSLNLEGVLIVDGEIRNMGEINLR